MKDFVDRMKRFVSGRGQPTGATMPIARNAHFQLSTRGGTVAVSTDFSIRYTVAQNRPCWFSQPTAGTNFSLTLIQSPSGSGKTTLLRELYAHIHRHGGASKLNFDFRPDYTDDSRIACGFIPQHPPLVKHWRCGALLPKASRFLEVFFPEFESSELAKLSVKRVGQLSGGQVRRLLACSALEELCDDDQADVAFLLLDETFDGIGAAALADSMTRLRAVWLEKATKPLHVLLVTHLTLHAVSECLADGDLAVAMDVSSRDGDALETLLRNEQWSRA